MGTLLSMYWGKLSIVYSDASVEVSRVSLLLARGKETLDTVKQPRQGGQQNKKRRQFKNPLFLLLDQNRNILLV